MLQPTFRSPGTDENAGEGMNSSARCWHHLGIKKKMDTFFQEVVLLSWPDHLCTGKMLDINIEPVVAARPVGVAIEKF